MAVAMGNIHAIRLALTEGADPGWLADNPFVDGEQRLPAFFWAAMRGNIQVIRQLLEMGFDPSIQDGDGRTALFVVPPGPAGMAVWDELCAVGLDPNLPALDGSVAWGNHPAPDHVKPDSSRTWAAPRPTLGPSRHPGEEDEE